VNIEFCSIIIPAILSSPSISSVVESNLYKLQAATGYIHRAVNKTRAKALYIA
jgi:hypothetical protein